MTEFVTRYYLSFDTLMLQPVEEGNKIFTRVTERHRSFTVPQKPLHIVTSSCTFYGTSYKNVMNTSRLLFGDNKQKAPLLTANAFGIPLIFIPTLSPLSDQNVWISSHAIDLFEPDGLGISVSLENGKQYKLGISMPTMYRQYSLAKLLEKNYFRKQRSFDRSSFLFPSNDLPSDDYPNL